MIPYVVKLKEASKRWCPVCNKQFKQDEVVMVYLHSFYRNSGNIRYIHETCWKQHNKEKLKEQRKNWVKVKEVAK